MPPVSLYCSERRALMRVDRMSLSDDDEEEPQRCELPYSAESAGLHEAECNAYKVRIEFLERTLCNYRSLPADLLGSFDVSRCNGNCDVLRQNFWDVWNTNASLNSKFENEMQRYKDVIKGRDDRIMELESVNALLEKSLSQSSHQLFEARREAVESRRAAQDSCRNADLEAFFTRKLDEERSVLVAMRARIAELEESLYLKEQESGARQMQINHLLSLPNQLEHASDLNLMRNKLREADARIQELTAQRFVARPCTAGSSSSSIGVVSIRVSLEQDQRLASRFRDFFRRLDADRPLDAEHAEEHMYDQFLLDQPNQEQHRLNPDMYLREELVWAMRAVCGREPAHQHHQRRLEARHGQGARLCRQDFAACLASMGGRFKRRRGVRYWVNLGMTRRPLFAWDV